MGKNYIVIYADDYPFDVWSQYCNACEVDGSSTEIKIYLRPTDVEAI